MQQRQRFASLVTLLTSLAAAPAHAEEAGAANAASQPAAPAAVAPIAPASPAAASTAPTPPVAAPSALPLDDLRTFVDVFDRIRSAYVEPVSDKTLFENAIRGMLTSLDPHSAYLDKKAYADLQQATTGEYDGVGFDIGLDDGFLRIVATVDNEPAAKASIKAGDYIIKIEGKVVQGMALNDAVNLIQGKAGTTLNLTMLRKGEALREVALVRKHIEQSSVDSAFIEPGIAALRISQFQTHTGRDFQRALEKLATEVNATGREKSGVKTPSATTPNTPITGLIIDLRNNPGGIVGAAIAVSDALLNDGIIVSTRGRTQTDEEVYKATPGELLPGVPVVVLVDSSTASAAEIVSGALQDNRRALIVGSTTFGKGSVQTVLAMPSGRAIKLTTARYYTPSGRSIQAEGIKPDIEIAAATVSAIANTGEAYHEVDLQGHLNNEMVAQLKATSDPTDLKRTPKKTLLERDFQMAQAVNILKARIWAAQPLPGTSAATNTTSSTTSNTTTGTAAGAAEKPAALKTAPPTSVKKPVDKSTLRPVQPKE